jgi:dienelactone hydrolase
MERIDSQDMGPKIIVFIAGAALISVILSPMSAFAGNGIPSYVDTSSFSEVEFTMQGEYPLHVSLVTAHTDEPNPVVLLYNGFSLRDRDESDAASRPFRDIAWGLATKGIASIRFDSRAFTLGPDIVAKFDLDKYLLDDIAALLAYVRMEPDLFDTTRIFLAGHGLGGFVAPAVAQRDSDLAGIILLSASARPPHETLLENMTDIPGGPAAHKKIEKDAKDLVRRLAKREVPPEQILFFAPAQVWYDLMDNNGVEIAKEIETPFLVLQGGRDKEVAATDFSKWKKALSDRKNARFEMYDSLSHYFEPVTDSTGGGAMEQQGSATFVDEKVIDDIAAWIMKR